MAAFSFVIKPFDGDQAVADAVAAHHLAVRLQQRADAENDFITTNLYDSQADLKGMHAHYIEPGDNFFIAYDSKTGEIAGFIGLKKVSEAEGEIKRMAVLPAYRRQGLGTRLAETAVEWATKAGFSKLHLYTGEDEKAVHVYKAIGFKLGNYRPDCHDYLMTLDLG